MGHPRLFRARDVAHPTHGPTTPHGMRGWSEKIEAADGMRNRVERLRVWLLGSAIFLMLVIAAFIGSARYVARIRKLAALPAKLGIDVKGGANGYTLSRTVGSKTIFTLHAARWEQHTDGKYALHDVSVIVYGKNGDRHDRIYGDEFEYDTSAKVMRALGLVHIDLAGHRGADRDKTAGGQRPRRRVRGGAEGAARDAPAGWCISRSWAWRRPASRSSSRAAG